MDDSRFTPEQVAKRSGIAQVDKDVRQWLVSLPVPERLEFLKRLWLLNYRYSLILLQPAQLPRQANEHMLKYWLRNGSHNAAQELIRRLQPALGETKFWQIASQEELSPAMRDFMNYYSRGRLDSKSNENRPWPFLTGKSRESCRMPSDSPMRIIVATLKALKALIGDSSDMGSGSACYPSSTSPYNQTLFIATLRQGERVITHIEQLLKLRKNTGFFVNDLA